MNALLLSFRLGEFLFGVPANSVVELSREIEVSRVPGSPNFIKGLINLRGQLAIAVDLKRKMGLSIAEDSTTRPLCIFMETDETLIGLVVDDVHEIFNFQSEDFVSNPVSLGEQAEALVSGGYKLTSGILHVINVPALLKVSQHQNFSVSVQHHSQFSLST